MSKKNYRILLVFFLVPLSVFFFYQSGPVPPSQTIEVSVQLNNQELESLDLLVKKDQTVSNLKLDNEARIIWADSMRQTDYCLLYLPGFTATYIEGEPLHKNIAKKYGWNLYLPRTKKTGLTDVDAYKDLTIEDLVYSAEEAYQIARGLGKKVIIMSCSTGGSLSLYLASRYKVAGLLMYSPNIRIASPFASLLTGPWGLEIAQLAQGGKYRSYDQTPEYQKYWYTKYRVESLVTLQQLLEEYMNPELFEQITCPVYVGYYKSIQEEDEVVSIEAMKQMFASIQTPESLKRMESFDAGHHAMISKLLSKDMENIELKVMNYIDSTFPIMQD